MIDVACVPGDLAAFRKSGRITLTKHHGNASKWSSALVTKQTLVMVFAVNRSWCLINIDDGIFWVCSGFLRSVNVKKPKRRQAM